MKNFKIAAFGDEISSNLLTQVSVVMEHDISNLDIRSVNNKNVLDFSYEDIDYIKGILDNKSIGVSSIASPIGKSSIDTPISEIKKQLTKAIYVSKSLDCRTIRIFSFYSDESTYNSQLEKNVTEKLKMMTDIAGEKDILLSLENEKKTIADNPIITRQLLETIGSDNLSVVFDFANYIRSGLNTMEAFHLLRKYITAFHMKDALYEKDIVVPCGLGDGNLREILHLLFEEDFSCWFSIEPHLKHYFGLKINETECGELKGYDSVDMFSVAYLACKKLIDEALVS